MHRAKHLILSGGTLREDACCLCFSVVPQTALALVTLLNSLKAEGARVTLRTRGIAETFRDAASVVFNH